MELDDGKEEKLDNDPKVLNESTLLATSKKHRNKGKHHGMYNGTDTSSADISSLRRHPSKKSKSHDEDFKEQANPVKVSHHSKHHSKGKSVSNKLHSKDLEEHEMPTSTAKGNQDKFI